MARPANTPKKPPARKSASSKNAPPTDTEANAEDSSNSESETTDTTEATALKPPRKRLVRSYLTGQMLRHRWRATLTDSLDEILRSNQDLRRFLEFYPQLVQDLTDRGLRCMDLGLHRQSLKIFSFLLKIQDHPLYHVAYADSLVAFKRYEECIPFYRKAIELAPQIPSAYLCLARILLIQKLPADALALLHQMLKLDGLPAHLIEQAQRYLEFAKEAKSPPFSEAS